MARIATTTLAPNGSVAGWRSWRIIGSSLAVLGLARQRLVALWPHQSKSPGEKRAERKQHQKAIRRQLRGLK